MSFLPSSWSELLPSTPITGSGQYTEVNITRPLPLPGYQQGSPRPFTYPQTLWPTATTLPVYEDEQYQATGRAFEGTVTVQELDNAIMQLQLPVWTPPFDAQNAIQSDIVACNRPRALGHKARRRRAPPQPPCSICGTVSRNKSLALYDVLPGASSTLTSADREQEAHAPAHSAVQVQLPRLWCEAGVCHQERPCQTSKERSQGPRLRCLGGVVPVPCAWLSFLASSVGSTRQFAMSCAQEACRSRRWFTEDEVVGCLA